MGPREIEIVLMRQLASYLAVPILIVDRNLDLLFYNEPAEPILGRRFDETGEVTRAEWDRLFRPADASGNPIPLEERSLPRAINRNEPSHRRHWLTGLDGVARVVEGLAFPLESRRTGLIGAVGVFWEVRHDGDAAPPAEPVENALPRSAHAIEVILLRRLADRLTMPVFVIGSEGRLLFYNPPAEPIIGRRFADLGPIELREWYDAFQPTDENGSPIKREDHPMYVALEEQQPCYRSFWFQGLDGVKRKIEGTAFPLLGQCNRHLGAVGIFWEETP